MKFLCTEKLSSHRFKTPEGYLICTDAILARTGKQTYLRKEVFGDQCDNGEAEIEVDRPYNEVFSKETLASFENKPITVEHPDENVNCENWKEYQVGFVRDIKQGKSFTGEDIMTGTLVIQDADTISEIERGEHTEISCGYDCDVEDTENPYQKNIRGNHIALCQQGRAGIARIIDSIKDSEYHQIDMTDPWGGTRSLIVKAFSFEEAKKKAEKFKPEWKFRAAYQASKADVDSAKRRGLYIDSVDDGDIKVWQVRQGYAIVVKRYWQQYGKNAFVDATESSIEAARYHRGSLERNDKMDFVIIDCNDGKYKIEDSEMKDIQSTKAPGTDKIIYTMQSDTDKNLYFYIGKTFSMKEGLWGYTKFEMGEDTPEKLKAELTRNGWHQVVNDPAKIIDVSNDEQIVEKEDYDKVNKSASARDAVEKNFKIYVKNVFGAYKVADWPAVSKEAAVKEFLELNPEYRKKGTIEARDASNDEGTKVYQCKSGYVIVPKQYYDRYEKYAYIERRADNLDEARNARQSLERNDGLKYVIVDCNNGKYSIVDSCNEYKIKYKDSKGNCHIHIVNADSIISAVKKVKKD